MAGPIILMCLSRRSGDNSALTVYLFLITIGGSLLAGLALFRKTALHVSYYKEIKRSGVQYVPWLRPGRMPLWKKHPQEGQEVSGQEVLKFEFFAPFFSPQIVDRKTKKALRFEKKIRNMLLVFHFGFVLIILPLVLEVLL